MGGASFSKSAVSALCAGLDPRVRAFNERRPTASYRIVLVDALVLAVREGDWVVPKAALIVSGVRADGIREILGVPIDDSEFFATWGDFFKRLKARAHLAAFVARLKKRT